MKKLYRKSTVHPTPSVVSEHLLSFLPAAILTLTAALSPAEREVLAYLISCSSVSFSGSQRRTAAQKTTAAVGGGGDHAACFSCSCFRCYMSYWAKWDSSPNRQLIHEVIDAFEESLLKESRKEKNNKKERRKGKNVKAGVSNEQKNSDASLTEVDYGFTESNAAEERGGDGRREEEEEMEEDNAEEEFEKGSMRRFVSFLGERIWSVWG